MRDTRQNHVHNHEKMEIHFLVVTAPKGRCCSTNLIFFPSAMKNIVMITLAMPNVTARATPEDVYLMDWIVLLLVHNW